MEIREYTPIRNVQKLLAARANRSDLGKPKKGEPNFEVAKGITTVVRKRTAALILQVLALGALITVAVVEYQDHQAEQARTDKIYRVMMDTGEAIKMNRASFQGILGNIRNEVESKIAIWRSVHMDGVPVIDGDLLLKMLGHFRKLALKQTPNADLGPIKSFASIDHNNPRHKWFNKHKIPFFDANEGSIYFPTKEEEEEANNGSVVRAGQWGHVATAIAIYDSTLAAGEASAAESSGLVDEISEGIIMIVMNWELDWYQEPRTIEDVLAKLADELLGFNLGIGKEDSLDNKNKNENMNAIAYFTTRLLLLGKYELHEETRASLDKIAANPQLLDFRMPEETPVEPLEEPPIITTE